MRTWENLTAGSSQVVGVLGADYACQTEDC